MINYYTDKNTIGYKLQYIDGKPREVKMKQPELKRRKKGARLAARKVRAKRNQINRRRNVSMKKEKT